MRSLVERGERVRAFARASSRTESLERLGVSVIRGSLTDESDLATAVEGVDGVFHLGGVVTDDPSGDSEGVWRAIRDVNVAGSERLARIAWEAGVRRFVFCSSLRVFGFGNQLLWSEDGPRSDGDLYGRGKALAEEALLRVGRETGLEVVIIRPRFIYGDEDRYVLPRLVALARRGRAVIPGRDATCDIVYVRDCVDALLLALDGPVAGETFNVTSGECLTLREILHEVAGALGVQLRTVVVPPALAMTLAGAAEGIARVLRRTPPVSRARLRWYVNDHHFSIAKARERLGYSPRYRLTDALREIDLQQFVVPGGSP